MDRMGREGKGSKRISTPFSHWTSRQIPFNVSASLTANNTWRIYAELWGILLSFFRIGTMQILMDFLRPFLNSSSSPISSHRDHRTGSGRPGNIQRLKLKLFKGINFARISSCGWLLESTAALQKWVLKVGASERQRPMQTTYKCLETPHRFDLRKGLTKQCYCCCCCSWYISQRCAAWQATNNESICWKWLKLYTGPGKELQCRGGRGGM